MNFVKSFLLYEVVLIFFMVFVDVVRFGLLCLIYYRMFIFFIYGVDVVWGRFIGVFFIFIIKDVLVFLFKKMFILFMIKFNVF